MKFLHNEHSDWFKQHRRVQSTEITKAYAIIRRNGEFPNFSLRIIQELEEHFLYDLENEEENEFLAAVDLEAVDLTDKVDNKSNR